MRSANQSEQVKCPEHSCRQKISQDEILALLGPDYKKNAKKRKIHENSKVFKQKDGPANEKHLKIQIPDYKFNAISKKKCTKSDCGGIFVAGKKLNELVCNDCTNIYCIGCGSNHQGQNCQEYNRMMQR